MAEPNDPAGPVVTARDLTGMGHLTMDAVTRTTDLVEALHQAIANVSIVRGAPENPRTKGITGLVYRSIHATTEALRALLDPLSAQVVARSGEPPTSPAREGLLAALNGVLGDHLESQNNVLCIPMRFRQDGEVLNRQSLQQAVDRSRGELVVLVHGLCMSDLQWSRNGHDHGAAIACHRSVSPIYLHYNTGRHISVNGRCFSELLDATVRDIETDGSGPVSLTIIGHSMGGLVARSACHHGETSGHVWPGRLRKMIFLGTPHHGSFLEKGGNYLDLLLDANPYSAPFSRLGKIRSSGITDLRHGFLVDEDWQGQDRFAGSGDHRRPIPLPREVASYAIAGSRGTEPTGLGDHLIGDGLVSLDSALGRHPDPRRDLAFPEAHQWVGSALNHLDLLDNPRVTETILKWLDTRG